MKYLEYLNSFELACEKKAIELKKDERVDEAHFEKIRGSIVAIFKGVMSSFTSKEVIKEKILQITKSWEINKIKFKDDIDKETIETIKLETRDILLNKLEELYEN